MKFRLSVLNLLIALTVFLIASTAQAALSLSKQGATYTIKSRFYQVTVSDQGGRILSFYDKAAGRDITSDGGPGQSGGLLDDKQGLTYSSYDTSVMRHSSKLIELRLAGNNGHGVSVVKWIYFRANRPVIQVREQYINDTQAPITFWSRNFIAAGGRPVDSDRAVYCLPLKKGWTGQYLGGYARSLRGYWAAEIDQPTALGFALVADEKLLNGFYFWHGKGHGDAQNRTFEFFNHSLPAGRKTTGTYNLVLLHGLKKVTLVTPRLAANVQPKVSTSGFVKVIGQVLTLDPAIKKATISVHVTDARGITLHQWPEKTILFNDGTEKIDSFSLKTVDKPFIPGKYVLYATVTADGSTYQSAPVIFEAGKASGAIPVALSPVAQPAMQTKPIEGWKSSIERFSITNQEKQKGFWLSRGTDKQEHRLSQLPLKAVVGLNEKQALHFTVHALKSMKNVQLNLQATGDWKNHLAFFQENNNHLEPLTLLTLNNGTSKNVWIILNSQGLSSGSHQTALQLRIGSHTQSIPLDVRVYPVTLPKKHYLQYKGYTFWSRYIGYDLTPQKLKRLNTFVTCYADMGGSTLDWAVYTYDIIKRVTLKSNGELVSKYIKKHPLDLDHLPSLQFDYFKPVLEIYLHHGIRRFEMEGIGLYPIEWKMKPLLKQWFPHIKLGTPQADKVFIWYMSQVRNYMKQLGFTSFWAKISDEFGPQSIQKYIQVAKLVRQANYRPYSTITGAIPRSIVYIRELAPYIDEWQLHFYARNVFHKLTHDKFKLVKKQVKIKGSWGHYTNGEAKHTWVTRFFGTQTPYGIQNIDQFTLLEDGHPLQTRATSPWGNTKRGCVYLTGSNAIYVSPSSGTIKDHHYTALLDIRIPDPHGHRLVHLNKNDQLWFYRGLSHTATWPSSFVRQAGWLAAAENRPGYAFWTFWWNRKSDNKMVFFNIKTGKPTFTPVYWGVRDGWEEGEYLCELLHGMTAAQRQNTLAAIMSPSGHAPLYEQMTNGNMPHRVIENRNDPAAWAKAKSLVLAALVKKQANKK